MTEKGKLLKKINEAFAKSDIEFILEHVTDSIKWTAVGDFIVEGKEAFSTALKQMEANEPYEINIHKIITHGNDAAVNGTMTSKDGQEYAFCDVYKFSGFKETKISEMTSYVVEIY